MGKKTNLSSRTKKNLCEKERQRQKASHKVETSNRFEDVLGEDKLHTGNKEETYSKVST